MYALFAQLYLGNISNYLGNISVYLTPFSTIQWKSTWEKDLILHQLFSILHQNILFKNFQKHWSVRKYLILHIIHNILLSFLFIVTAVYLLFIKNIVSNFSAVSFSYNFFKRIHIQILINTIFDHQLCILTKILRSTMKNFLIFLLVC